MFEKILVPVDLTPKNEQAVEIARRLTEAGGGRVTLLHVIETLDLPWEEVEDFYQRLEARAREKLDTMRASLRAANLDCQARIVFGPRAEEVVAFAAENDQDVIVLSSHRVDPENPGSGWTTLSYKIAILAQCPVLLVK